MNDNLCNVHTQSFTSLKCTALMSTTAPHASKISCMSINMVQGTIFYVYVFPWCWKLICINSVVLHKLICMKMMLPPLTAINIPSGMLL